MRARPAFAAVLFACSLLGQQESGPVISESIEVRVTNVDVVVTDRDGNHVTGLTAADFDVVENEVLQPITNFYEYAAEETAHPPSGLSVAVSETPAAPNPPRYVVLFLDRVVLPNAEREKVFDAYDDLIDRTLRPDDEAMIVTYNTSLRIEQEFTSDKAALKKIINSIGKRARTNWEKDELKELENLRKMWQNNPEFDLEGHMATSTRALAMQRRAQLKNRVQSLNALMTSVAGLEGRKILVLSSDKFQRLVGLDLFMARDYSGPPPADATEFNAEPFLKSLSGAANANGFTIYAFHPKGLKGTMSSAEFDTVAASGRDEMLLQNDAAGLDYLARETGGLLALGPSDVEQTVVRVAQDLDSYYSLGYRTRGEPGKERDITVRVKKPGLTVRTRRSMLVRSADAEIGDKVIANLFRKIDADEGLKIRLYKGDSRRAGQNVIVPVKIEIPIGSLTALPNGQGYAGSLSLYVASADPLGGYSNVIRQKKPFTIKKDELTKAQKGHFTYEIDIKSNGAKVSVAVVDDISRVAGFGLIEIPEIAGNRPGPMGVAPSAKTPAEKRGDGWKF